MNLYVLVFLQIGTRRLWLSPATRRPDTAWVCEQAESFLAHAHSTNLPATIMLRDNDVKYPPEFDTVLKSAGLDVPKMPVRSPNLRAHVERVIQTLQHEALDRVVVVSERHLNVITRHLQNWYSSQRSHSARDYTSAGLGTFARAKQHRLTQRDRLHTSPRRTPQVLRPASRLRDASRRPDFNHSAIKRHATGTSQVAVFHLLSRTPRQESAVDNPIAGPTSGHLPAIIPHFQSVDCLAEPAHSFCTPRVKVM